GTPDAFVSKFSPAGGLLFSTYLGGGGGDKAYAVAVDAAGSAYVTGSASSTNFPTTAGAYQSALSAGTDAFVTKFAPAGDALVFSTYLGGGGDDAGKAVAVDATGAAYVAGNTQSSNFPTASAYQSSYGGAGDVFVTKLTPAGGGLTYSGYLGGA